MYSRKLRTGWRNTTRDTRACVLISWRYLPVEWPETAVASPSEINMPPET